jgi:diguanylate cyclase (GGDEF)-like protein
MWEAIRREGYWQGKVLNQRKDQSIYPQWLAISAIRDSSGEVTHYFGEFSDISEPREAERKILELAYYDPLTGLPNRRLLHERLEEAPRGAREEQYGALLLIDLDHFKTLNDARSHGFGDRLLIEVAQRLRSSLHASDTAARLGGDEFVIVLDCLGREEIVAAANAECAADRLRESLSMPYVISGTPCHVSASIGITLFHDAEESAESLLKQADLALYQAKRAGRNTSRFFNPVMQAAVDARAEVEIGLHRALAHHELQLYYQPQVDADGGIIGVEALVRWQPPSGPMVSPAQFIPIAEESGLILPIGQWVLTTACHQIGAWAESADMCHLTVSVNISAQQFRQPDFVDQVRTALSLCGKGASRLKLELTESSVVEEVDEVIERMHAIRTLGVSFSMDDFGTGYSSLANLKRLPLDQLKIDQGFVHDIPDDADDCAIARAIIALGHSLHLQVIAEGVENEAQREFLAQNNCVSYQGYLFGKPSPAAAIEQLVRNRALGARL